MSDLHTKFDSHALLGADWRFVRSKAPVKDIEAKQKKIFKELMKQKQKA